MDTSLLKIPPKHSHTGTTYLEQQYTLRACNRDYRQSVPKRIPLQQLVELDGCRQLGKIAPLTTFDSTFGHCVNNTTRVFDLCVCNSILGWIDRIEHFICRTIKNGYAWDLDNVVTVEIQDLMAQEHMSAGIKECIDSQITNEHNPICVYPAQAYVECREKRGKRATLYSMPTQSTLMTGILGGINNNTTLEMGFEEQEGTKDMEKRTYKDDMFGFICCGHTAHSQDAGKSRRVASFTRVRVLSKGLIHDTFCTIVDKIADSGKWKVYCMGLIFYTNLQGVVDMIDCMDLRLKLYAESQFNYPNNFSMCAPPTYAVYYKYKVLSISISPGTLLRLMPDGSMIDSCMYHHQPTNPIKRRQEIPSTGANSIKYKYSAFFLLCPYLEDDRPPRTLLASGQTVQAVCYPWAPATAKVSPCHSSKALVSTEFMRRVEQDQNENEEAIWDILPGEDMLVCFCNLPLNYDDAMIVSSKFADYSGFETLSVCTYRLFSNDTIPVVGEEVCGKKHKWWKMPCTNHCVCKGFKHNLSTEANIMRIISNPGIPSAIVLESNTAENGEYQIRVLSHAQLLTGDKISTTHGQKGVVRIVQSHDLPVIVMNDGSVMTADLYMAVGSVTSRQTVGQIFESSHAYFAAVSGSANETATEEDVELVECDYLLSGETGEVMEGFLEDKTRVELKASIGFARVFNQTQLTRERHHLTHSSEGKYSLGTSSGRAAGGGVATSEMDFHAMFSSGMLGCAQELLNRGNVVRVMLCTSCKHIQVLCDCGLKNKCVQVRLSYDTIIFDIISACVNKSANTYEIEHV